MQGFPSTRRPLVLPALALWVIAGSATLVVRGDAADTGSEPATREAAPSGAKDMLDIGVAARAIDALIQAQFDAARQQSEPDRSIGRRADDATFLRRVYLDAIGRIPNADETRRFLNSKARDKRTALIDELLASPGYVSHNFNYFADLLRVKTRLNNRVSGEPYIDWLKRSIAASKPYDVMVREMITAEGAAHRRGNGATGYLLRDRNMPLDNMANTARLFLGTRIECAQCHNHPTEKWTQRQFFELAAFTGGLRYQNSYLATPEGRKLMRGGRALRKQQGEKAYQYFRRTIINALQAGISGSGNGVTRLPDDYQYDDAQPKQLVTAQAPFGESPRIEPKIIEPRRGKRRQRARRKGRGRMDARPIESRQAFAEWLTATENEPFTTVIANRMWKKLMGRGLIEPVDDLRDDTVASNPALMHELERLMRSLGYDLREFQRIVLNTKAYQREAVTPEFAAAPNVVLTAPVLRRLTAEQMWDSLLTLVVPNLDEGLDEGAPRAEAVYARYEAVAGKTLDDLKREVADMRGSDGSMKSPAAMARERRQARNKQVRPLYRELRRVRRRGDTEREEEILARLRELGVDPDRVDKQRQYGRNMLRASEIATPAPPGHFLRDFGQSDREQIDAAHRDATVPQVLNLVNGFVDEKLLAKRQGVLLTAIRKTQKTDAKVKTAYLTILNRPPRREELRIWRRDVDREGDTALDDLVWTLVNSHEFRFVR